MLCCDYLLSGCWIANMHFHCTTKHATNVSSSRVYLHHRSMIHQALHIIYCTCRSYTTFAFGFTLHFFLKADFFLESSSCLRLNQYHVIAYVLLKCAVSRNCLQMLFSALNCWISCIKVLQVQSNYDCQVKRRNFLLTDTPQSTECKRTFPENSISKTLLWFSFVQAQNLF